MSLLMKYGILAQVTARELTYYGRTSEKLTSERRQLQAGNIGDYALFAGGMVRGDNYASSMVEAYNKSLIQSIPSELSFNAVDFATANVGNYVLFGGGCIIDSNDATVRVATVDAYNKSLVRSTPTALSKGRRRLIGANNNNYALFGGGDAYESGLVKDTTVDAYNASLVRTIPTPLSVGRDYLAGAQAGDYALFAGGIPSSGNHSGGYSNVIDVYNASLVRTTPITLSVARAYLAGASVGRYALFGGGLQGSGIKSNIIDVYNDSLVMTTPLALSEARQRLCSTSHPEFAFFGLGSPTDSTSEGNGNVVDAVNTDLVLVTPEPAPLHRRRLACTFVGDYILISGGLNNVGGTDCTLVEVYQVI